MLSLVLVFVFEVSENNKVQSLSFFDVDVFQVFVPQQILFIIFKIEVIVFVSDGRTGLTRRSRFVSCVLTSIESVNFDGTPSYHLDMKNPTSTRLRVRSRSEVERQD